MSYFYRRFIGLVFCCIAVLRVLPVCVIWLRQGRMKNVSGWRRYNISRYNIIGAGRVY